MHRGRISIINNELDGWCGYGILIVKAELERELLALVRALEWERNSEDEKQGAHLIDRVPKDLNRQVPGREVVRAQQNNALIFSCIQGALTERRIVQTTNQLVCLLS